MSELANLSDAVGNYMALKFQEWLTGSSSKIQAPIELSAEYIMECDRAVEVIWEAYRTRLSATWDVNRYRDHLTMTQRGQNVAQEEKLAARYPPIYQQRPAALLEQPCVMTDCHGNVLESLWEDIKILDCVLDVEKSKNWRVSPKYYKYSNEMQRPPGTTSMSPGWFMQGHETREDLLHVSSVLKGPKGTRVRSWIERTAHTSALLGGILAIVHPELYQLGRAAQQAMLAQPELSSSYEEMAAILHIWSSPFSALTVIVNRETPFHRDVGGRHPWYDMLVTFGDYHDGRMELPGLGFRLRYDPGTVVALCGRVVRHGVARSAGERACIAYYMRDAVQEKKAWSRSRELDEPGKLRCYRPEKGLMICRAAQPHPGFRNPADD